MMENQVKTKKPERYSMLECFISNWPPEWLRRKGQGQFILLT